MFEFQKVNDRIKEGSFNEEPEPQMKNISDQTKKSNFKSILTRLLKGQNQ